MKLKYAQYWNGKFALCPVCGKAMARGYWAKGIRWTCLMGCGFDIHVKPKRR